MKKLLATVGALALLLLAPTAYGSTLCTAALASQSGIVDSTGGADSIANLDGCTLSGPSGSVITFTGFTLSPSSTLAGGFTAQTGPTTLGFQFAPSTSGVSYSLSYVATCDSNCAITGGSDSDMGGSANGTSMPYSFTITPDGGSGPVNHGFVYSPTISPEASTTNSGSWSGAGAANVSITLDITAAGATSATPEPTSLLLFGTGFLGIGLLARRRSKA